MTTLDKLKELSENLEDEEFVEQFSKDFQTFLAERNKEKEGEEK